MEPPAAGIVIGARDRPDQEPVAGFAGIDPYGVAEERKTAPARRRGFFDKRLEGLAIPEDDGYEGRQERQSEYQLSTASWSYPAMTNSLTHRSWYSSPG